MTGMAPTRTFLSIEVATEAPEHPPRSILSTDVNILGISHVGCLLIATGRHVCVEIGVLSEKWHGLSAYSPPGRNLRPI